MFGLPREDTNVIRQIACRKIVRSIDDEIVVARRSSVAFSAVKLAVVQNDIHCGLISLQSIARRFQFLAADIFRPVKDLSLQIRNIDPIVIDQSDRADSRRGEIKRGRRAEPARADTQDARRFQCAVALRSSPPA